MSDREEWDSSEEEEEDELSVHTSDEEFIDDDSTSDWDPEEVEEDFEPMEYLADEVCGGCILRYHLDEEQLKELVLPATDCVACTEWKRRK